MTQIILSFNNLEYISYTRSERPSLSMTNGIPIDLDDDKCNDAFDVTLEETFNPNFVILRPIDPNIITSVNYVRLIYQSLMNDDINYEK